MAEKVKCEKASDGFWKTTRNGSVWLDAGGWTRDETPTPSASRVRKTSAVHDPARRPLPDSHPAADPPQRPLPPPALSLPRLTCLPATPPSTRCRVARAAPGRTPRGR